MWVEDFQKDLRTGMSLEKALNKYNLTLGEALELVPKPLTKKYKKHKVNNKRNFYKNVGKYIRLKNDSYLLRKTIKGKSVWGGSYYTLEDAEKVRDFLEEHGWNKVKINQACKELGIERRKR